MSFNGAINEVKIYDEALTAEMIQAAMIPGLVVDSDDDGLSDVDEVDVYGTDPNDPDSDDDGIEDGAEVRNSLDPNSAVGDDGASGDPDDDTLSNLDEIKTHGTDPQKDDSDGDNLKDNEEIEIHLTDPNDVDSDDDNFNDDVEIAKGSDPNDPLSRPQSSAELPDPLLYYPFNLDAGTEVENLGSLSTAGILEGGAVYGESIDDSYGTAFYGNRTGANDAYVTTGFTGIDLSMGASSINGGIYTAMAWINWDGSTGLSGAQGDHMVFGAADGPGNNSMLHHGIRDEADGSQAHFGHWGNDLNNAGVIVPDEWTHLAFQYDGTDKVVYINGIETARGTGGPLASENLPVIIGGHGRDAADPAGQSFNGAIDEVKVYAEALTEEQILAAMEPGSGGSGNAGFAVTSISYDSNSDEVTLIFNSRPGRTYRLAWTADFSDGPDYIEIDDSIAIDEGEEQTSYTFSAPRPDSNPGGSPIPRKFFIIQQNE